MKFNLAVKQEGQRTVMIPCECAPRCPRSMRVVIDRDTKGGEHPGATWWFFYTCSGDVDHAADRSARPDLRNEYENLRVMSRPCHRLFKDHTKKTRRLASEEYNDQLRALARRGA